MNKEFNKVLKESFISYLKTGERSNEKLKILHGFINEVLSNKISREDFVITSLTNNSDSKEIKVEGLYYNKNVDITITNKKTNSVVCGVAVKFIMSNYSQNSNNYFEQMIGETANIRGKKIPYYQIFIIDDIVPYFSNGKIVGGIKNWEKISNHNLSKYQKISNCDASKDSSIPNKILIYISEKNFYKDVDLEECKTRDEFKKVCLKNDFFYKEKTPNIDLIFGENVFFNDFEAIINDIVKIMK